MNTARVWDGVRITQQLGNKNQRVDAFASKLVPIRPNRFNGHARTGNHMFDSRFYGLYFTDKQMFLATRAEAYLLIRDNRHAGDHVNTFGLRYAYQQHGWDSDGEVMLQTGHFGFLRHQAFAAHIGIGRNIIETLHLGLAYNYGSGDSSAVDTKHQTFDNLYPLNHAYYGYMDLFSLQNIHNTEAIMRWDIHQGSQIRLAYEGFWLDKAESDAWYNAGADVLRMAGGAASSYVGSEIDLTYATSLEAWPVTILTGYSHFFAGAYVADIGTSSDANFFFTQSKWRF